MAPQKKKVAPTAAEQEAPQKKAKRDDATVAKGEFVTFLTRVKAGVYKKKSEGDREEAASTLLEYHSMAQSQKAAFAMAFLDNKDKKSFAWARDYIQSVKVTKVDESESTSKYTTRSSCTTFSFNEAAPTGALSF